MNRRAVTCLLLLLSPAIAVADALRGVVTGPDGHPIAEAVVSVDREASMTTAADGRFAFDLPRGAHRLTVAREGFQPQALDVSVPQEIAIALKAALRESIVVSSIRADAETPITKSELKRADIAKSYFGQDIPFLLRDTPSINAYAEGGIGGAGYSYITLRGMSPTRLNFTLDGVPLSDSEDMTTYFVDFPDLAHSLDSIQVQRGVGTSTVGSPSFGGSVNLESIALSSAPATDAWIGAGSFGTRLGSVAYQTGSLAGGIAAYGRLSVQDTAGFREHSGVQQRNLFVSAAKQADQWQLKLTGFAGHEKQQESFLAVDEDTVRDDPRFNQLSPDDRDSFGYNLAQLQYMRANLTASIFFQRGYGWYTLDGNRYGLDGLLAGGMLSYTSSWRGITANYGVHVNQFRREHTGAGYANYGAKNEANGFAKFSRDLGRWRLYLDAQLRSTSFRYHGNVRLDPIRWTFFNPKIGARYELSPRAGIYASTGLSRREPGRNDLFQGEDNPTFAHDLRAVRPERLLDFEAGWDYHAARGSLSANLYAMDFHNEIAATGELSELGLPLRRNVDRSFRRGVEIEARWQLGPSVALRGNATLSSNRIRRWTQAYDVYDAAGNFVGSETRIHRDVHPLVTPEVLLNSSVEYTPLRRVSLIGTGRFVGKSYLDNTNNAAFTLPSFVALDGSVAFQMNAAMRWTLQVTNALNNRRIFPSGYSYLFVNSGGAIDGVRYFYPQATRNAVLMLDVHL